MKGWVYVITNKGLLNLVKIGFTEKDPEYRAKDLSDAGHPYPCVVEYEVLVDNPRRVEQQTHKKLASRLESKEWFRCSIEDAVYAIKEVASNNSILEIYHYKERINRETTPWASELIELISLAKKNSSNLLITEIHKGIGVYDFQKMKDLNLCGSHISVLPNSIGNLINLTNLQLMSNKISTLPDGIQNLSRLQELNLGENVIVDLSSTICTLKNLKSLFLQFNKISRLPEQIGDLSTSTKLLVKHHFLPLIA